MKLFRFFALVSLVDAGTFDHRPVFGMPRGGGKKATQEPAEPLDDYERAQAAIFHGIETVEHKLEEAVADEVKAMFPDDAHHEHIHEAAKQAVKDGASKVKAQVQSHARDHPKLPYEPHDHDAEEHHHRILHSLMAAEQAVVEAVHDEVDVLFHHEKGHSEDHKETVKKGVQKAQKKVQDSHAEKRQLMKDGEEALRQYMMCDPKLWGIMGI